MSLGESNQEITNFAHWQFTRDQLKDYYTLYWWCKMKTADIAKGSSSKTQIELNEKRHLTNAVRCKMHLAVVKICISDWTNL